MHFVEWRYFNFDLFFTDVCSLVSDWQLAVVSLDNGLASDRRQAIIWTSGGQYINECTAPGLNDVLSINIEYIYIRVCSTYTEATWDVALELMIISM